jgi:hypothetical protein
MSSIYSKLLNPSYPIVLAQYKRDDYGVGDEEELHWALIVIISRADLEGHCFQAVDRNYTDGRGKVWTSHYAPSASLRRTRKCLGGVQIGSVKARDLDTLIALIKNHPTVSKFDGWNYRNWILEIVEVLRVKGWISETFTSEHTQENPQSRYLARLREASVTTAALSGDKFVPDVRWIQ